MTSKGRYKMADKTTLPDATWLADGMQNVVSGLGTGRDKAFFNQYVMPAIADTDLSTIYRSEGLAKLIVDLPAVDAFREWRSWKALAGQINQIEMVERKLAMKKKFTVCKTRARLHGWSALLIGTGTAPDTPLDPSVIGKGGLKYLLQIDKVNLSPNGYETDLSAPGYGKPRSFTYSPINGGAQIEIHPSRLVIFVGSELPDDTTAQGETLGDPVLLSMLEKMKQLDGTLANIASLVFEAKIDIVKIPNLMQSLADGGQQYEQDLIKRFTLSATTKGINGTVILDAKEEYEQKNASFSALPEVSKIFMTMVSALSGIPMSKLFGQGATGMNATGEGDARNYYDSIRAEQTIDIQSALSVLDEVTVRSALGDFPDAIFYEWNPLWQLTEAERANVGKTIAETVKILVDTDLFPPEALSKSAANMLVETGVFPGLEQSIADYTGEVGGSDDEDDVAALITDAKPRSLYVSRKLLNGAELVKWAKGQGFTDIEPADEMHVTVMLSQTPVDWMKVGNEWSSDNEGNMTVAPGGPRVVEGLGPRAVVLLFNSSSLAWRHEDIKRDTGAVTDHPDYIPHVTISFNAAGVDLDKVKPFTGALQFGPEIFAEAKPVALPPATG